MVTVQHLTFEYADKKALDDVSFEISKGEITALVGPNGAGKTTLMRCIAALSKPMAGEILVNGRSVLDFPKETHQAIGYLSDFFGLYDSLTVEQSIHFAAHSRLRDEILARQAAEETLAMLGIESFLHKKINTLSRGMKQRVGIAQAIVHKPALVILDEPASGLDPEARYELSQLMLQLKSKGMTLLVSSHILAELEDYCTDMLVLHQGKIIEHTSLGARTSTNGTAMELVLAQWPHDPMKTLENIPGLTVVDAKGEEKKIYFLLDQTILSKSQLLKQLLDLQWQVEEISTSNLNLQEVYIKSIKSAQHEK